MRPFDLGDYALGAVRERGEVALDGPRAFRVPVGGMVALERVR